MITRWATDLFLLEEKSVYGQNMLMMMASWLDFGMFNHIYMCSLWYSELTHWLQSFCPTLELAQR